ncbi:MAG: hypothetical protein HC899_01360 [Leptolyngbyaceae cyanobacterium SM1_4_3]|nr:hypothetical protein [Leptolyngbyaceae cyanobacterium SM1_4_3]
MPPSHIPQSNLIDRLHYPLVAADLVQPDSAQPLQLGCVELDFEDLSAFEQVRDQYSGLGIKFAGAIALQPSNPAFLPRSGSVVLMPMTNGLSLSAYLYRTAQTVGAFVTGTKQVRLTAFNREGKVIAQSDTGARQYVQEQRQTVDPLPQRKLELTAGGIARVEFASDAPFTMDDFFCG